MILHVAGLAAAEEALRDFHIGEYGYDPTDPTMLRRTAALAISAYLSAVQQWDRECREFGCHDEHN